MMDGICGINFNARVLDPTIGRFFSADTLVANSLNGQSFNRYFYVNNGPLSATDPTGHAETIIITGTRIRLQCIDGCGGIGFPSTGNPAAGADRPIEEVVVTGQRKPPPKIAATVPDWDINHLLGINPAYGANSEKPQRGSIPTCPGLGGQECGAPTPRGGLNPDYPGVCHWVE